MNYEKKRRLKREKLEERRLVKELCADAMKGDEEALTRIYLLSPDAFSTLKEQTLPD